VLLDIRIK